MIPVIWFYGLSGSGKTTLASYAHSILPVKYYPVVFLDADELRKEYWPEIGLSKDARLENTRRIAKLAKSYYKVKCAVIVAACAPFQQQREEALEILPIIKFIHVNTPLSVCQNRKPHTYGENNQNKITLIDAMPNPWQTINCDQDINKSVANLDKILDTL